MRVLLADNHTLVRAGIRSLLESLSEVEVVGEAADGQQALTMIKERNPDIVFMDIAMERMNGLEATRRAVKTFPRVRVIILSIHSNEEYVSQALRAGASGYMLKDAAPSELEARVVKKTPARSIGSYRGPERRRFAMYGRVAGKARRRLQGPISRRGLSMPLWPMASRRTRLTTIILVIRAPQWCLAFWPPGKPRA